MSEQSRKSPEQVNWEVETDQMVLREGKRIYGDFILAANEDRQLWRVDSYKGRSGAPGKSLEGQFTGQQMMLRKCDEWLSEQGLPPVADGPSEHE